MNEKNPLSTHINDENIITSEGVTLKVEPATLVSRILAFLIDLFFYFIFTFMVMMTVNQYGSFFIINSQSYMIVYIVTVSLIFFFIPLCIETFTAGYSAGKFILGIRVLRDDGGIVHFRHVFTRHLIGIVENYTFFGAASTIVVMSNRKGKRFGDLLAGTYVANYPSYNSYLPLVMPQEFEEWANHVNVLAIPPVLLRDAKSFINRANNFTDSTRSLIAEKISSALLKYVDLSPGENYDKERFIAAVLIVHRDNEFKKILSNNRSNF